MICKIVQIYNGDAPAFGKEHYFFAPLLPPCRPDNTRSSLPRRAYNILQSVSAGEQEILLQLLETACNLKNFKQY